jgi:hypothetical protein
MNAIHGTYLNGMIVPDEPLDWPDGTRVYMEVIEDEDSPEAIAKRVALMEEFLHEPVMSEEEADKFEVVLAENRRFSDSK